MKMCKSIAIEPDIMRQEQHVVPLSLTLTFTCAHFITTGVCCYPT
jgi:hypothetical protein